MKTEETYTSAAIQALGIVILVVVAPFVATSALSVTKKIAVVPTCLALGSGLIGWSFRLQRPEGPGGVILSVPAPNTFHYKEAPDEIEVSTRPVRPPAPAPTLPRPEPPTPVAVVPTPPTLPKPGPVLITKLPNGSVRVIKPIPPPKRSLARA
ncbi:MAG TPA: hypothetical protein VMC43_03030 [Candidatus Paceibacterota bacterium]|nr:hypothetical protein [Candidatus Paceibacterota bacterium]